MEFLYETIRFNVKSPIMDSLFFDGKKNTRPDCD